MPNKTPADRVFAAFGGVKAFSKATGIPQKTAYRWRFPAGKGGSDGRIPSERQRPILDAAKRLGIELNEADVVESPCPEAAS